MTTARNLLLCSAIGLTLAGCTETGSPAPDSGAFVEATSFVPAPPQLSAQSLPTPQQLSALVNAARNYGVDVADRVKMIEGNDDDNYQAAQKFATGSSAQTVEFTSVIDLGNGLISATGVNRSDNGFELEGSINFVADDGVWKIKRDLVCALVGGC